MIDAFVAAGDDDMLAVAKIMRGSRALQERLTVGWEAGAGAVTAAIAGDLRRRRRRPPARHRRPHAVVDHRSIFLLALNGLLAEEDRGELAARLRVTADRAYDQLAVGLGDYGRAG